MAYTGHNDRVTVNVDVSNALIAIKQLQLNLNPKQFAKCMEYTVKDTGNRAVKGIVKRQVAKDYQITQKWAGEQIKKARYSGGGDWIKCEVPIKGHKGTLGGTFPAGGGGMATGKYNGKIKKRLARMKGAKITAIILRGKSSKLPIKLKNQGGNPPFRIPNGAVMTRRTDQAKPIVRVSGRSVSQMTDKQFDGKIETELENYMVKRFEQNAKRVMKI